MPPKTWQDVSPASLTARRKASRAEPLRKLCEACSGAIATTMPSIRSNWPDDCWSTQARNSSRVLGVSGSWVWARAMAGCPGLSFDPEVALGEERSNWRHWRFGCVVLQVPRGGVENRTERTDEGSHVVFSKGGRTVVVPNHAGDIKPGMLRSICHGAGWEYPPKRRRRWA